jgi:ribosomal protein L11 methylase PrmA
MLQTAEAEARIGGSFRDPSGFVFQRGGRIYRQLNRSYSEHYEHLMESGLYAELTAQGALIPHEEVTEPPLEPEQCYRVLAPERAPFISYPYEWCFSQLKEAALTTLRIQRAAVERGMSLRDASAFNIQFHQGRAVFIDTSSFEQLRENEPWVGYQQFCRHFLAPLALIAYRDVRLLSLLRTHLDGIPLDLAAKLLPMRSRLKPGLLMHIHAHAATQRRAGGKTPARPSTTFGKNALLGLIDSLESSVKSLSWAPEGDWAKYYQETNYSDEAFEQKRAIVEDMLLAAGGKTVWDLGANTGPFSRLAAGTGARPWTLAVDLDPAAVETNYHLCRREAVRNVLPLVGDLANPSADLGWAGEERQSLAARGPADVVLALALVHHLAIGNNTPLKHVAGYFAQVGRRLIVEFIPKGDSQVERMLASREDIFGGYHQPGFEAAFERLFAIERCEAIPGTKRTLYLMRRQ